MSESTMPPTKHQCGTCGAVFDSLEALQEHQRQHQGERARGEASASDTRRTGSHAGSNVSAAQEGKPHTKQGTATTDTNVEVSGREQEAAHPKE